MPGAQQGEDEIGVVALGVDDRGGRRRDFFGGGGELGKGPAGAGTAIGERKFVGVGTGGFAPAVVKHCHSGTRNLICGSSMLWRAMILLGLVWLGSGCASVRQGAVPGARGFEFSKDTFAYVNELVWEYRYDPKRGTMGHVRREPPPTYAHHCYPMARAARQFFHRARFVAEAPRLEIEEYRRRVREVVSGDGRLALGEAERVVIPGYASLREFSAARRELLQAECGAAWESYWQRGNWRLVWPFPRSGQARTAAELEEAVAAGGLALVHLVRFPALSINHVVVVYGVRAEAERLRFAVYDPNDAERPRELVFERATRTFSLPPNHYWAGGRVDVYEIGR